MPRTLAMPAPGCCWICRPGIAASHRLFSAPPSGIHEPPCGPVIIVTSCAVAGTASVAAKAATPRKPLRSTLSAPPEKLALHPIGRVLLWLPNDCVAEGGSGQAEARAAALVIIGHVPALGHRRLSRLPRGADRAAARRIGRRAVAQHAPADGPHDPVVPRRCGRPELPPRLRREPRGRRAYLRSVRRDRAAARLRGVPRREPAGAGAGARALPIARGAAAAGARLRLHPGVLLGHAAVARQRLGACR